MHIEELETFVVGNRPGEFGGEYFIFIKLVTNTGVVGYGEHYGATFGPDVVPVMIRDIAERHLIGNNPFEIERFWHRCLGSGFSHRPDISLMGCVSALEMACWDIIGKEVDQPAYQLLGGRVHDTLRSYTYLYPEPHDTADIYSDPDTAAERAAFEVSRGFTAVKFDPAGPYSAFDGHQPTLERLDLCERMVAAVREAVGTKADILFGTHGQFTASGALRLARRLEQYDPLWFEEPVPPDNPAEMAKVASQTTIPIATGERLTTKAEFARLLELKAASILQMNLGRVGGLLEAKKIGALAEANGAQLAPHLYCGPIVGAANVQLATCSPNFLILESIRDWSGIHADLLVTPMQFEDGHVIPPTAPGLGVELNEEFARANPYTGDQLHLQMDPNPVTPRSDRF
ncbi:MAG: mandelate racemase/muconate lactonizing enzyme family protein [Acidimicrobiales bacterium]|jgi:galactonate dehydratase